MCDSCTLHWRLSTKGSLDDQDDMQSARVISDIQDDKSIGWYTYFTGIWGTDRHLHLSGSDHELCGCNGQFEDHANYGGDNLRSTGVFSSRKAFLSPA